MVDRSSQFPDAPETHRAHFHPAFVDLRPGAESGVELITSPPPAIGGIPQLVQDGETGLTFEAGNPQAPAHCLVSLLKDEGKRRLLGRNARKKVQDCHPLERMITDTQRVLVEALVERRS